MKALKTEVQLNVFRLLHSILPLSAGVTKKTNQTMLTPTEDTQHLVLQASNHAVPLCWLVSYSYFSAPISRASKILAQGRLPHSLSECVAITTCTPNILPVALFEDTSLH